MDHTPDARIVNGFYIPLGLEANRMFRPQDVIRILRMSEKTFSRFKRAGLKVYREDLHGGFVDSDEVIEIIKSDVPLPPPYKSPHAEKNKERRRKKSEE